MEGYVAISKNMRKGEGIDFGAVYVATGVGEWGETLDGGSSLIHMFSELYLSLELGSSSLHVNRHF